MCFVAATSCFAPPYSRDATATFILTLTLRPNLALHWSPSSGHDPAGRDANASP